MINKILDDLLKQHTNYDKYENGQFYYTLHADKDERKLPNHIIKQIFKNENPRQAFIELLDEWSIENTLYEENYIIDTLKSRTDLEEDIIIDYVHEHCSFNYDADDFDESYNVNLTLDTGDAATDFTANNALNYFSDWSTELTEPSAILWLAKQMDKSDKLLSEMKTIYSKTENGNYVNRDVSTDKFIESVIQELENNTCSCSGLTFLVNMKLSELFTIKEQMNDENSKNNILIISKDTMCGLFDEFAGGGSVLEIELDKDINITYAMIHNIWIDGANTHGYDVNEVYGLVEQCWKGTIVPKN